MFERILSMIIDVAHLCGYGEAPALPRVAILRSKPSHILLRKTGFPHQTPSAGSFMPISA
jgi:hypothetical protein